MGTVYLTHDREFATWLQNGGGSAYDLEAERLPSLFCVNTLLERGATVASGNGSDEQDMSPYQSGTRVKETGVALVHEGEYIMPASGSEATFDSPRGTQSAVINYYFPVEIVFVGRMPEQERADLEANILDRLRSAIEQLT
jgi:hypothetical protein